MNTYLIRDINGAPYNPKAESVEQAIEKAGLEIEQVASVEVMIPNAMPPNNWKVCELPEGKPRELRNLESIVQKLEIELSEARTALAEYQDGLLYSGNIRGGTGLQTPVKKPGNR